MKKDEPYEKITKYFFKLLNGQERHEQTWRDYCELRGIPLAIQRRDSNEWIAFVARRNRDKDSLNQYFRRNRIALLITPGKIGQTIIIHKKDDAAHAEIIRTVSREAREFAGSARRFDDISQAEGLSTEAVASLQKVRGIFSQQRTILAKSVNKLGLPEPKREDLMNQIIPPGKQPWESEDDYESEFKFEANP